MLSQKITDIAQYRTYRQHPAGEACHWSEAMQTMVEANIKAAFVLQRLFIRMWCLI